MTHKTYDIVSNVLNYNPSEKEEYGVVIVKTATVSVIIDEENLSEAYLCLYNKTVSDSTISLTNDSSISIIGETAITLESGAFIELAIQYDQTLNKIIVLTTEFDTHNVLFDEEVNVTCIKSEDTEIIGVAQVTLSYTGYSDTKTWNGTTLNWVVPNGVTYTVSWSDVTGYEITPNSVSYTASGIIKDITGEYSNKNILLSTITSSSTYTCTYTGSMGLLIVGGGGGGAGDAYTAGNPGNGGNGGQVRSYEITVTSGDVLTITIGTGGTGGSSKNNTSNATQGGTTSVVYNGTTYSALGGYGGKNLTQGSNTSMEYSRLGGKGGLYNYGNRGIDGYQNPYDEDDENLYAASGNGGNCTYQGHSTRTETAITGGGQGGYGSDNASTNTGYAGTFYGAGGGGMAFSSNHVGKGGAGYQGVVLLYQLR